MKDGEPICPKCLAEAVARNATSIFSEDNPDVKMSLIQWHDLRAVIEDEIKDALCYEEPEEGTAHPEKVTVQ